MATIDDAPLCVECFYKFEVAKTLAARLAIIGMNHAAAEMDFATGLHNFTPRMQVPDIPQPPIVWNNIKVDNSVVGSINTGNVQSIDVNITYLQNAGSETIGNTIKVLTEAIANNVDLSGADKNNALDQVAYLSEQAAAAAKDRRPGMIRAALSGIAQIASTVSAVSTAWAAAAPIILNFFGVN